MAESDSEFLDSMEQWVIGSLVFKREHRERLFALARKGAAVQMAEDTQFARIRQLEDEAEQYRRERDHAREISIRYETELARKGVEGWRPISDPPPEFKHFLATDGDVRGEAWRSQGRYYWVDDTAAESITHWQPLPPPPKQDNENE